MANSKEVFLAYVEAYNRKEVERMLSFFDDACVFENISGGKVAVRTEGKAELAALATKPAAACAFRKQTIVSLIEARGKIAAEVSFEALLQADLTPELKASTRLQVRGVSICEISNDKIVRLTDYS